MEDFAAQALSFVNQRIQNPNVGENVAQHWSRGALAIKIDISKPSKESPENSEAKVIARFSFEQRRHDQGIGQVLVVQRAQGGEEQASGEQLEFTSEMSTDSFDLSGKSSIIDDEEVSSEAILEKRRLTRLQYALRPLLGHDLGTNNNSLKTKIQESLKTFKAQFHIHISPDLVFNEINEVQMDETAVSATQHDKSLNTGYFEGNSTGRPEVLKNKLSKWLRPQTPSTVSRSTSTFAVKNNSAIQLPQSSVTADNTTKLKKKLSAYNIKTLILGVSGKQGPAALPEEVLKSNRFEESSQSVLRSNTTPLPNINIDGETPSSQGLSNDQRIQFQNEIDLAFNLPTRNTIMPQRRAVVPLAEATEDPQDDAKAIKGILKGTESVGADESSSSSDTGRRVHFDNENLMDTNPNVLRSETQLTRSIYSLQKCLNEANAKTEKEE